jgi:hypothetical protein
MGGLLSIAGIRKHFLNEARMLSKLNHPQQIFHNMPIQKSPPSAISRIWLPLALVGAARPSAPHLQNLPQQIWDDHMKKVLDICA